MRLRSECTVHFPLSGKCVDSPIGLLANDVHHKIVRAVVDHLMRFSGLEEKRIAGNDRIGSVVVPHATRAGDDAIELPLHAMRMKDRRRRTRQNALNFRVES
jgi:hypothetical protein